MSSSGPPRIPPAGQPSPGEDSERKLDPEIIADHFAVPAQSPQSPKSPESDYEIIENEDTSEDDDAAEKLANLRLGGARAQPAPPPRPSYNRPPVAAPIDLPDEVLPPLPSVPQPIPRAGPARPAVAQAAAAAPPPNPVVRQDVRHSFTNLTQYPSSIVEDFPPHNQITKGDAHGNVLTLLNLFIKMGYCTVPPDDFQEIVRICSIVPETLSRPQIKAYIEDIGKFIHNLKNIQFIPASKEKLIRLLGDLVCERGPNDILMMEFLKLLSNQLLRIVAANHDFDFVIRILMIVFPNAGLSSLMASEHSQIRSFNNMIELLNYEPGPQNIGPGRLPPIIKEFLNVLFASWILLDYSRENNLIKFYHHAPGNDQSVIDLAKKYGIVLTPNSSTDEICDALDIINLKYRAELMEVIPKLERGQTDTILHAILKEHDDFKIKTSTANLQDARHTVQVYQEAYANSPRYALLWRRKPIPASASEYLRNKRGQVVSTFRIPTPTFSGRGFSTLHFHGHEIQLAFLAVAHILSLDSQLGKNEYKAIQSASGQLEFQVNPHNEGEQYIEVSNGIYFDYQRIHQKQAAHAPGSAAQGGLLARRRSVGIEPLAPLQIPPSGPRRGPMGGEGKS